MSQNCPLCGSTVPSLAGLKWREALNKMPGPVKLDAMKQMTSRTKPTADGRWLYATKDGSAIVASPGQIQSIAGNDSVYGEQLED